jgi:hypothetical protein
MLLELAAAPILYYGRISHLNSMKFLFNSSVLCVLNKSVGGTMSHQFCINLYRMVMVVSRHMNLQDLMPGWR